MNLIAREYLGRVGKAERRAERLRQRAMNMRMLLTDTASHMKDVPHGGSPDLQRHETIYAEIDELERKIREAEEEAAKVRIEVGMTICRIEDPTVQKVLMMHFLNGMSWREVAAEIGYSIPRVRQFGKEGLEMLENYQRLASD